MMFDEYRRTLNLIVVINIDGENMLSWKSVDGKQL